MKLKIFLATQPGKDPKGNVFVRNLFLRERIEIVESLNECDVVFIYVHNPSNTLKIENIRQDCRKPIVVFDFIESLSLLNTGDYQSFIERELLLDELDEEKLKGDFQVHVFLKHNYNNIKLYFRRELQKQLPESVLDLPFSVLPVDYPLYRIKRNEPFKKASRDLFFNRNIDLLFSWSNSYIDRIKLFGHLLSALPQKSGSFGHNKFSFHDNHCERLIEQGHKNIHFYSRRCTFRNAKNEEISNGFVDWLKFQSQSLACIDLYGGGIKCVRNPEAAYDCVSFKQDPSVLQWAYEWKDGENCIVLPNNPGSFNLDLNKSGEIIKSYLTDKRERLFEIYLNSFDTAILYTENKYVNDYIFPEIQKYV